MNRSEVPALRAAVRRIDDAMSKFLAGITISGLALVLASCRDLRAADLDETGAHFVSVIARSAEMLESADGRSDRMPSFEERVAYEIELLKGIWRLDAHLRSLATAETDAVRGVYSFTEYQEQ